MTESQGVFDYVVDTTFTSVFATIAIGLYTLPAMAVVSSVGPTPDNWEYVLGLTVVTWSLYIAQRSLCSKSVKDHYDSDVRARLNRWANITYHNIVLLLATLVGTTLMSMLSIPDVGVLFAVTFPLLHHEFVRRSSWSSPIIVVISQIYSELAHILEQVSDVDVSDTTWGEVPSLRGWMNRYQGRRAS